MKKLCRIVSAASVVVWAAVLVALEDRPQLARAPRALWWAL